MDAETTTWLRSLQARLWKHHPRTSRSYGWSEPIGKLTREEWERVKTVAESQLCMMSNSEFGFALAMIVASIPADPPYPGVPYDDPEHLVTIAAKHLPEYDDESVGRWDFAWAAFSTFTNSNVNQIKLKEYGLPTPQSKSHYEY